jgi:transcriptional regulator with XRE-family HTH domain
MPRGVYPHTHIKPKVYPEEMVQQVRRLYIDEGMSQAETAEAIGVTLKVVYRLMKNHDIPRRPKVKRDQRGEKNSFWRGDAATYKALHYRVYVARGLPKECVSCSSKDPEARYEWANLTGQYADVNDYARMCVPCHRRFDAARRKEVVPNVS